METLTRKHVVVIEDYDRVKIMNMVFVKTSHGMQKYHKCCVLKYNEGWLKLVFACNFCKLHVNVFKKC
jgi:hypothetical protein